MVVEAAHVLVESRWRFWARSLRVGAAEKTRCFPNYEPVVRYALLAMAHREEQTGIVKKRRAGASLDFHQLREYQDGDVLSRVDWKATARRGVMISRDYEEQRNQTLVLALDCGRRMRAQDGELTQFDHALNTALLLAFLALRQGDEVGVLGFGGELRWLKPVRGVHCMTQVLNHLYDYRCGMEASDFKEAAVELMLRQKRRAMVVFLSNLRTEDGADLEQAVEQMRARHLVVVASLKEAELEQRALVQAGSADEAFGYGALSAYDYERELLLRRLRGRRVELVDETAEELPVALASRYFDLKAAGRL
jgi:uncharacterized protein (DUF58 family)